MSENVTEVTDNSFEKDVLQSDKPVLVDFWAAWCVPCRQLSPIVDELATQYGGRLKVAKLNVDDAGTTAARYGIKSIPTVILFKNGAPAATKVGAEPKSRLKAWLEGDLASAGAQRVG